MGGFLVRFFRQREIRSLVQTLQNELGQLELVRDGPLNNGHQAAKARECKSCSGEGGHRPTLNLRFLQSKAQTGACHSSSVLMYSYDKADCNQQVRTACGTAPQAG